METINLINAVAVQTYWMPNFTAAQMDFCRKNKFGLCSHSPIGARMMSVMEEMQGKQKSGVFFPHPDAVTGMEERGL